MSFYKEMESDSEIEAEIEEICKQFPNSKFSISLPLVDIDNVVINTGPVAIKCDFNCYCYSEAPRISEFYICKKEKNITNRDLINCLIDNKFDTKCNHHFLEGFEITSSGQVEPYFGS